jgi:glycosyltransferase involved in cell wall biosynthesis
MKNPDISVVVCTQNRAGMLREALASLFDLATEERFTYEIVVVDNGSTDETPQVISEAARASKNSLRGVSEPQKGIVPARNRGIREARGRWVAFFDDDQLADPWWLVELWQLAEEKHCRVVGGAVHLKLPKGCRRQLDPTVRMLLGEAQLADHPVRYGGRLTPGCGNLMIERSVFDEVGVFERTVSGRGEDTDLFSRIERANIDAWYAPTAVIHHLTPDERLQATYLLRLARNMGEGIAQRQVEQYGRWRFALLCVAKAARLVAVQYPLAVLSRLRADQEGSLGRRCLMAIHGRFLWTAARWLCPEQGRVLTTKYSVLSTAKAAAASGLTKSQ